MLLLAYSSRWCRAVLVRRCTSHTTYFPGTAPARPCKDDFAVVSEERGQQRQGECCGQGMCKSDHGLLGEERLTLPGVGRWDRQSVLLGGTTGSVGQFDVTGVGVIRSFKESVRDGLLVITIGNRI